jgi:hypothetical protein
MCQEVTLAASPVIDLKPFEEFYSHNFSCRERLQAQSRAKRATAQGMSGRQATAVERRKPSRSVPEASGEVVSMTSRAENKGKFAAVDT